MCHDRDGEHHLHINHYRIQPEILSDWSDVSLYFKLVFYYNQRLGIWIQNTKIYNRFLLELDYLETTPAAVHEPWWDATVLYIKELALWTSKIPQRDSTMVENATRLSDFQINSLISVFTSAIWLIHMGMYNNSCINEFVLTINNYFRLSNLFCWLSNKWFNLEWRVEGIDHTEFVKSTSICIHIILSLFTDK